MYYIQKEAQIEWKERERNKDIMATFTALRGYAQ